MTVLILAAPGLGVSLLVGLAISILQATTQVQEQTLTFVPKIVAVYITLMVLAGWLLNIAANFTIKLYSHLPALVR